MSAARKTSPHPQQPDLRERATSLKERLARASGQNGTPQTAHPRDFANQFDFSTFTVAEVARLSEACRMVSDIWLHLTNSPYCCWGDGGMQERPIWYAYDFEYERMGFLRDRCIKELEARVPKDRDEQDEILSARLRHELECNDSIVEPGLLVEAIKAWG